MTTQNGGPLMPTATPPFAPAAPARTREQRMAALDRANVIRMANAKLKREIKAGRRNIVDVLLEPPEETRNLKLVDLLLAVPAVGRVKANKLMVRHRISPSKTVGGLSQRQRAELVIGLGRR